MMPHEPVVAFLVRGAPGLGRVTPSLALWRTIQSVTPAHGMFLTTRVGTSFLRTLGEPVQDLGATDGLFLNPLSASCEAAVSALRELRPDLLVVDGEPLLLPFLRGSANRIIFIANPYDLLGPDNWFRRVHHQCVREADQVVVPSLDWDRHARQSLGRYRVTPPFVRSWPAPLAGRGGGIVVTLGGGVVDAGGDFRRKAEEMALGLADALRTVAPNARIMMLPGVGLDRQLIEPVFSGFDIRWAPEELGQVAAGADLVIARAGRSTLAELWYYRRRSLIIPTIGDPLRGAEQCANAERVASQPGMTVHRGPLNGAELTKSLTAALESPSPPAGPPFEPSNLTLVNEFLNCAEGVEVF